MEFSKKDTRYPMKYSSYSSHFLIKKMIMQISNSTKTKYPHIKILDIGCSTAELWELLQDLNISYTGIEPFEADAEIAKKELVAMLIVKYTVLQLNTQFKT